MKGDHSLPALIGANVVAVLIALAAGMGLLEMMLVYWVQSVIIGVATFARILSLKRFDPENLTETVAEKWRVGIFFLVHYGGFHYAYFFFLTRVSEPDPGADLSLASYLLCALVFALNQGYTLLGDLRRDALGRPKIKRLMMLPYPRILPMHLTIIAGGFFMDAPYAFPLFVALKIAADAVMHVVERRVLA